MCRGFYSGNAISGIITTYRIPTEQGIAPVLGLGRSPGQRIRITRMKAHPVDNVLAYENIRPSIISTD